MKSRWLTTISVSALALGASAGSTLAAGMDDLVAAAKKEGTLTTIALPHDWCGYGDVIAGFKAKYGLEVNELNPDAGSGDEIEAIKANKGNTGPQAPDVIDVGLSFGPSAKTDGLIQAYKVSTWDTIPDSAKDADGAWYGDYYGVLSFAVNTDIIKKSPTDWGDLTGADYKNGVALAGDPRASNQAIQGSEGRLRPIHEDVFPYRTGEHVGVLGQIANQACAPLDAQVVDPHASDQKLARLDRVDAEQRSCQGALAGLAAYLGIVCVACVYAVRSYSTTSDSLS